MAAILSLLEISDGHSDLAQSILTVINDKHTSVTRHSILGISPEAFADHTSDTKALLDELHDGITRSFMKSPNGRSTDVRDLLVQITG